MHMVHFLYISLTTPMPERDLLIQKLILKAIGFVPLDLLMAIQLPRSRDADLCFRNNSLMESV